MSCGTGLKTKERSIVEQATNGGKSCEGHSIETGLCKQKDCFGMLTLPIVLTLSNGWKRLILEIKFSSTIKTWITIFSFDIN